MSLRALFSAVVFCFALGVAGPFGVQAVAAQDARERVAQDAREGVATQETATLALRSSVEITGRDIRLSDVFAGLSADKDRVIASAPQPSKSVTYDARVLANLAAQNRLGWVPESPYDRVVITRAAKYLTQDMLRDAVAEKLGGEDILGKARGKMDVLLDGRFANLALPADRDVSFALHNFSYDAGNKRFRADLRAETGGAPLMMTVSGRVSIRRDVPVLTRRLDAGEVIGLADLDWVSLPEDRLAADVVSDEKEIVGRALRRVAAVGQPLSLRDLIPPRLVARGSLVVLKVETPLMLITTQGRAMADGGAGDVIRVTNTQSNRIVEGTVEASGVVRVQTAQQHLRGQGS